MASMVVSNQVARVALAFVLIIRGSVARAEIVEPTASSTFTKLEHIDRGHIVVTQQTEIDTVSPQA